MVRIACFNYLRIIPSMFIFWALIMFSLSILGLRLVFLQLSIQLSQVMTSKLLKLQSFIIVSCPKPLFMAINDASPLFFMSVGYCNNSNQKKIKKVWCPFIHCCFGQRKQRLWFQWTKPPEFQQILWVEFILSRQVETIFIIMAVVVAG